MSDAKYLGIDLGTSNSAVAVFEAGEVRTILNTLGEVNTPSVVRVTQNGTIVGAKAQRYLHSDSSNTFKEFKRLMGTESRSRPDLNGRTWLADELSAEILKALKSLAEANADCEFDKAVVTVPALFELPQSNATANAARLAGFKQVELLPEPVASALAAGWGVDNTGAWLVYDLGGGTFDASLLESRDGLLRVVGHDGDNFLGGRDIDRSLVDWIKEELKTQHKINLAPQHPDYNKVLRHLQTAAETAKIRLSTVDHTIVELEFEYNGEDIQQDLSFSREKLNEICTPLIERSISICKNLVASQGMELSNLNKVVLVGGPAHMPIVQQAVAENLAPLAVVNLDPMSLVSRGAALYAATVKLACYKKAETGAEEKEPAYQVWLQYPSVCTELNPTILGRIIDEALQVSYMQITNSETGWQSSIIDIEESIFIAEVPIQAGRSSSFVLTAFDKRKNEVPIAHQRIDIVHGLTMSDPPLSRSIGVALADGSVKTFIERGTPLPAKRTFVQNCADTLVPRTGQQLSIPIVQGERKKARFCRKVGALIIDSKELKDTLHVGSPIEITIEVDRGGDMKAHAYIAEQGKIIEGVANLIIVEASAASLRASYQGLSTRITQRYHEAFRERDERLIAMLEPLSRQMEILKSDLLQLDDDSDACQRVLRNLMDIEAKIEQIEESDQVVELIAECEQCYYRAAEMVHSYGDDTDKRILNDCAKHLEKAIQLTRKTEIERLIERLNDLFHSAHQKSPQYWKDVFLYWASFVQQAKNPRRANQIVTEGRKAIENNNSTKLRALTDELYELIPHQYRNIGNQNHDSGVY